MLGECRAIKHSSHVTNSYSVHVELNGVVYKKKSKYLAICLEGMLFTYLGSHVWTLRLGLVYKCVGVGFVIGDEVIL